MIKIIEKYSNYDIITSSIKSIKSAQELIDIFTKTYGENINNWSWENISRYQHLTEDFIRKFKDYMDWTNISKFQKLSESFIREFEDKVNWNWISFKQTLSESFIREFKDKVNWYYISSSQKLSESFIRDYKDKIDLKAYYLYNPYANLQDKIKYMRQNGFIEQYNPNKHLLQNSEEIKENKDLQLFKELIQ